MNREEFVKVHADFCHQIMEITKRKNHDYTGADEDPFANFKNVESLGICSVEQGFLTRMTDKMSRLAGFCKNGKLLVKDESVIDTLLDLANYAILKACYLVSKERGEDRRDPFKEGEQFCDCSDQAETNENYPPKPFYPNHPDKKPSPDIMIAVPKAFLSDVHDTVIKNIAFLNDFRFVDNPAQDTAQQIGKEKDLLSRIAIAASEFRNNGQEL